ncbi:YbfB/YjiJ family MFS transporter [Rossellomorea vietnamensis]|uniref:MFS transporter n=1 Tax=Rossellomorea vietnamensis TaxID=218284 RepID=A0A0P6VUQ1_9BACI|nr:YbfB/YjiJ family MFS transporter [Rossellomorea vietnamensis]KPL58321.1 MFS transporter [Rossellomorea vietnamensis]
MNKPPLLLLLGGMFSLIIALGIGRFAYTPILPIMQQDLSFSTTAAGYIASSNYAGYLVGAVLTAVLPLKKHRTFLLRFHLILSIFTTIFMGLTNSLILWNIFRFLSGFASAFVMILASGIVLDKLASINKTLWSGLFFSGVGIGIFLSSILIPILNDSFQWEGTWIGLAALSVFLMFFVWIWLKDTTLNDKKKEVRDVVIPTPPMKWLPWLTIAYGLEGLGYIVTGTFIVSIAESSPSFHSDATLVWLVAGLAAIPSCTLWTVLATKWGYIKSLILAMGLQAIGIMIPVVWVTQTGVIISGLLFGATFIGITSLASTLGQQMNPAKSSRIIGILTAVYAIGQLIGPSLAGFMFSVAHSFNVALMGAAGVVLLGACLLLNGIKFEKKVNNLPS